MTPGQNLNFELPEFWYVTDVAPSIQGLPRPTERARGLGGVAIAEIVHDFFGGHTGIVNKPCQKVNKYSRATRQNPDVPVHVPPTVGARIEAAMKFRGVRTPAALATTLGVPRQTVYRWIKDGGDNIIPSLLFKAADALHVSPRWLAIGMGPMTAPLDVGPDDLLILEIANSLPEPVRDEWVRHGEMLRKALQTRRASDTNPFPGRK